ncbi:nuclease homologue [Paracoccus chinensis]|uniref:Nuclease homologue n=1 Tax=Paracoccus chinensis TaxID=525640 RepID=A0A1G9PP76_9RHOB|nr:nuclease homologue [Paracoccus chinensis]
MQDTDRYGRAVSVCKAGGKDINHWVVRNGWAVAYTRYSRDYEGAEAVDFHPELTRVFHREVTHL